MIRTSKNSSIARIDRGDAGEILVKRTDVTRAGTIVDALPSREGEFLLGVKKRVYRVRIDSVLERVAAGKPPTGVIVASHPDDVAIWVTDAHGVVRGVLSGEVTDDQEVLFKLWQRTSAKTPWKLVREWQLSRDTNLDLPLGFTADGSRMLVASNRDRDRWALLEMNLETGEFEGGLHRYEYLEDETRERQRALEAALPGRLVAIYHIDRDEQVFAVWAAVPGSPGSFYVYDAASGSTLELGSVAPWLTADRLATVEAFEVQAEGGPKVEAFLTRPRRAEGESGLRPLLVMPHGGPVGVSDDRAYDPMAQFFAHYGYEVLKVNYRGSSGYGRAFERAGEGQWGLGIEDDIDAGIDYVLARGWADPERMVLLGASYGGYSALMSPVRHPGRFRCAVSWMGVSDLPLWVNRPEVQEWDYLRESMVKIVGDPETEFDDLVSRSPAYRADEIGIPVMLVHGDRDRRVDIEHAQRMKLMLEKAGNPPEWMVVENHGHFMPKEETALNIFLKMRSFLYRCLEKASHATGLDGP